MRHIQRIAVAAWLLGGPALVGQKHELGLTLGGISGLDRRGPAGVGLGTGVALQANYGYRFATWGWAALLGEVHLLANPLRDISSPDLRTSRDVATLYVLPGVRLKFAPRSRSLSPYLVAGGGYALYEQSLFQLDGQPNPAPRFTHRGAFGFGGGGDFPIWRFIGGRIEIRDFYTGNPSYNRPIAGGGQHNVVAGGGFVLRFGGSGR